jgi:hypothetical protein
MQSLGSNSQSTLQRNLSQAIHPIGGVSAMPLSRLFTSDRKIQTNKEINQPLHNGGCCFTRNLRENITTLADRLRWKQLANYVVILIIFPNENVQ